MTTLRWTSFVVVAAVFSIAATPGPGSPSPDTERALSDVPGMDFSTLSAPAKRELATVLTDEFCHCGCPHALGQCLKSHSTCKHARRMALLAAQDAAAGVPATEIINSLSRYYQSFRQPRQTFPLDPRMCMGAKDAKVTVVEFSDFECPHCAAARPVLEEFIKAQGSKARLCFMPYPLTQAHPQATAAGQVALFARDQGKFWAMHDLLFDNQADLGPHLYPKLASKLGLNPEALAQAFKANKYLPELTASKDAGKAAGVDSTPSLFINGRKFNLAITTKTLEHTVDDEIEWQANKNSWAAD